MYQGNYIQSKGCLYLNLSVDKDLSYLVELSGISSRALHNQQIRDDNRYHITVITPSEMKNINFDKSILDSSVNFYVLGIGKSNGCYYLIVNCPAADVVRKSYKLPPSDFHVTIGFDSHDVHDINKDINTIYVVQNDIKNIILNSLSVYVQKNINQLEWLYNKYPSDNDVIYIYAKLLAENKRFQEAIALSYQLINSECKIKGYFILCRIKNHLEELDCDLVSEIMKNLQNMETEDSVEIKLLLSTVSGFIASLPTNIVTHKTILIYDKENSVVVETDLPRNFSSVTNSTWTIYGSSIIKEHDIKNFKILNIGSIINLCTDDEGSIRDSDQIKIHNFPILDRNITDVVTVNEILKIMDTGNTIVHCVGGVGRTNMILACYLIKKLNMSPSEAITLIGNKRNMKLSAVQIQFIKKFYATHNGSNNLTLGKKRNILPGLFIMTGLPCSGKTTLSNEFITYYPDIITHINQDDLGKKDSEELFSLNVNSSNTIILDRCNATRKDRQEWIKMYIPQKAKKIICIHFDIDANICKSRVMTRENHPSLSGASGAKIIDDISKIMDVPVLAEGFSEIITIKKDDDIVKLRTKFGLGKDVNASDITKFPRTKHLANLGSVSRDDLLYELDELNDFMSMDLLVEEKIDGANLGLFLEGNKIKAQNRSHYVDSSYHPQFKLLDKWIQKHTTDLMAIFSKGNYIVFGEWMYARHSINYIRLPDYFLIFDIYDQDNNVFLQRDDVEKMLQELNVNIKMVPVLFRGKTTLDELKKMVNVQSQFYDGPIEGVYVRAYENNHLKYRGKIVRANFLSGDEFWSKGKQVVNSLI